MDFIDPGIRVTVAALLAAGFDVCDAADGESDGGTDMPYVTICSDEANLVSDAILLHQLFELNDIHVSNGEEDGVQIQATYEPLNNAAYIYVTGVHDSLLPMLWVSPGTHRTNWPVV